MSRWLRFFSFLQLKGATPLPQDRLLRAITMIETQELKTGLPSLSGQIALEVAPQLKPLAPLLEEKGAGLVVTIGTLECYSVRSRWDSLPLQSASCHFVLCRAPLVKRDFPRLFKEVARVLKDGGVLYLTDYHPFSPMVQADYRKNPAIEEGMPPGFERYFKLFHAEGLHFEMIREVFFDSTVKKVFGEKERGQFEELKKAPFLVLIGLRKGERKESS